jgi:hypothetical protein
MRNLGLTALLATTVAACSEPVLPPAAGEWWVEVMNGLTMPAPTVTGRTLRYAVVRLAEDQTGSLEYCTALPLKGTTHVLRWRFLDGARLEFTYFNTTGTQPLPDTATVNGQSMNYRPKVVEADIGPSNWRLWWTAFEPSEFQSSISCSPVISP